MVAKSWGCPTCGSGARVRVRKGEIRRVKSPSGWGVRKGTPRKSMRVYWKETVKRHDGVWAKCPDPYHQPPQRRVGYRQTTWPPLPEPPDEPLPVVSHRRPKALKQTDAQRSKARVRRHLANQSKQRR